MQVTIVRVERDEEQTLGVLFVDGRVVCWTLEPPWRANKVNVSCIPVGMYVATKIVSEDHGVTLWVNDVPGRAEILVGHKGNSVTDTRGCAVLGSRPGWANNTRWLFDSGKAMEAFRGAIYDLKVGDMAELDVREVWMGA
jgi:hypothetical protein